MVTSPMGRFLPGRRYLAVLVLLRVAISPVLFGEDLYFEQRDLSALTVPTVRDIVEDERGYLWVATPGGLVRYDGINPILLDRRSLPGLLSDDILSLEFQESGTELWIGTVGGLVRFNLRDHTIRSVEFRHLGKKDESTEVLDLENLAGERMFALTATGVYYSVRGDVMQEVAISGESETVPSYLSDLTVDDSGEVWGIAADGLWKWDENLRAFGRVSSMVQGRSLESIGDEIWIGTAGQRVIRYTPESDKFTSFATEGPISGFAVDPQGWIWLASSSSGISRYDPGTGILVRTRVDPEHPYRLPTDRIDCLFAGSSGHVWVGTVDAGLLSVDIRKENHLEFVRRSGPYSLPAGPIRVIAEDSLGYVWAGSEIGGLARIDPYFGEIKQYVHDEGDFFSLSNDRISALIEDSSGRIWVGTDQGPMLYIPEVDGFEPPGDMMGGGWPELSDKSVLAIAEGTDGSIWMSFRSGELYRLDALERDFQLFRFTPASVPTQLLVDQYGSLWAGSRTNLRIFNDRGELVRTWTADPDRDGALPGGGVTALYMDTGGKLWLGSSTELVLYQGVEPGFQSITLPGDHSIGVSGIIEDGAGNIWVSDGRKIHIFDSSGVFWTTMDESVGFTPSGFVSRLSAAGDGRIRVGASGEIWTYDSPIENLDAEPPQTYLTGLTVVNENRAGGRELQDVGTWVLLPGETVFRIDFGAVDFRHFGDVHYEYRLLGFDRDWVDSRDSQSVTYARLAPGTYDFAVRAFDGATGRRGSEALLSIRVEKPAWLTWWAIGIYILAAGGLVAVVIKLREGRLLKTQVQMLEDARSKVVEANRKLEFLTMNDTLSGLLNRRGFDQAINHALTTANRNDLMISLFMMDVDFFKRYNDNYGHVMGDEVLRGVGKALRNVFERSTDIIARYGGEEFAVVFIGENPNATVTLANDLILAVEDLDIEHRYSDVSDKLTLSIGSATIRALADTTAESLIDRSDRAMYAAKGAGRMRVCYTGIIPVLPDTMKNGTVPIVLDAEQNQ